MEGQKTSLDLTHVLYDEASWFSTSLALVTLSPILLMASYAALTVQTREFLIITMWAGQFASEGLNILIKRFVRQPRPDLSLGDGYGFPSSHSQYMGYFSSFLIAHIYFTHRFGKSGLGSWVDRAFRGGVYGALVGWAGLVAYSRYRLGYHTPFQIISGLMIGVCLGLPLYILVQLWPARYPESVLGKAKRGLLDLEVVKWLQVRDGWAIWGDGGRDEEWKRWRSEYDRKKKSE